MSARDSAQYGLIPAFKVRDIVRARLGVANLFEAMGLLLRGLTIDRPNQVWAMKDFGAPSSTKKFTFTRMTKFLTHEMESVNTSICTTEGGPTALWDERRQTVYVFHSSR